jgi:hypothetical protein
MKFKYPLIVAFAFAFAGCDKPEIVNTAEYYVLRVYPNPVFEVAYVSVDNTTSTAWKLEFFDAKGKMMKEQNVPPGDQGFTLDLSKEPTGYYHITLVTNKEVITRRLTKIEGQ